MLIWHLQLQTFAAQIVFGAHAQGLVKMLYQNMLDWMEREGLFPCATQPRAVDKHMIH